MGSLPPGLARRALDAFLEGKSHEHDGRKKEIETKKNKQTENMMQLAEAGSLQPPGASTV